EPAPGVKEIYTDTFRPSYQIGGQTVSRVDTEVEDDVLRYSSPPSIVEVPPYPIVHPTTTGTFSFSNLDTLEVDGSTFRSLDGTFFPTDNLYYVNQAGIAPAHTLVNTGGGHETAYLQATTGPVEIDAGTRTNDVNVGSDPVNLPLSTLDAIQGAVTVTGS